MSVTLQIENYGSLNRKEALIINADAARGVSSLTLQNNQGVNSGDYIVAGTLGAEGSELVVAGVPNADQITLPLTAATKLAHKRYDIATVLLGTQAKIYRAPNVDGTQPADASFAYLNTATLDIDQLATNYTDNTGSSSYWYKFTYFNPTTNDETALADSGAARGGGYGHYITVDDIRGEAGFDNNRNISNTLINSFRIDAEGEVDSALSGKYTLPFTAPIPRQVIEVTKLIAAGLLLLREYGPVSTGTNKDGNEKLTDGRKLLDSYQSGEKTITDINGDSLVAHNAFSSWPDATTADLTADDHGGDNIVRMASRF